MDCIREPSRLFKELLDLEKDFKYNLTLLKIREEEIERCTSANRILQETVKSSFCEIERLNTKILDLEKALRCAEQLRLQQNEISQRKIDKLTEDMRQLVCKHRLRMEDYQKEVQQKEKEAAAKHMKTVNELERFYKQRLAELEEKLNETIKHREKVTAALDSLVSENMTIRNKLRETEVRCVSESSFYKTQLNTMQSSNANLNSENEFLRRELQTLRQESAEIKKLNAALEREVLDKNQKNEELIKDQIKTQLENKGLQEVRETHARETEALIAENGKLAREKCMLSAELENVKQRQNDVVECNVPLHGDYEHVVKQNGILRELVKSMRKEKQQLSAENAENIMMVDTKLNNLEELFSKLKTNSQNDSCRNKNWHKCRV